MKDILYPIPRHLARFQIGLDKKLPFYGYDIWNGYDLSWLNAKGKPEVGICGIIFPANSDNLIESKSLKLYLNSFNDRKFSSVDAIIETIISDLKKSSKGEVLVNIKSITNYPEKLYDFSGICLDKHDIYCCDYQINPEYLLVEDSEVSERLYSHLLRSNCPVTNQPDFGSVEISYSGKKINHEGLLKYIVSFREHNEFHEACVERMFVDILHKCKPQELTVYARYNRRGGLDINPFRTTNKNIQVNNNRLYRQ